jgi:hypothetical protein
MSEDKSSYKFGLYGRCPVCKDIEKEICEGCGATDSFVDSSKPGIVSCSACGLEHSIRCSKAGCGNQIKVLRTPKNTDEKARIDEFIYRKTNKDLDKRVFTIKENPQVTVVKEVKVPADELKKKEKREASFITYDTDIDLSELNKPVEEKPAPVEEKPAPVEVKPAPVEVKPAPVIEKYPPADEKKAEEVKKAEPAVTIDKEEPSISLKNENVSLKDKAPTPEEKQELDKIKNFWKAKELTEKEEKKEEERRIVNQFYDEHEDDVLDKKINFENIYNETVFFDCRVCGREEQKIVCEKCGQNNQFSLNYDALSCKCGNDIKVKTCDCGAKHGHSDYYLVSDGIKWQYSKSKSYYNYRKGRMLVFSTCPTCGVFSVEKCKVCGSKVNFGIPNKNNEIYCKNCGTVNQFICQNRKCNDTVKTLNNPTSIEQKLEWLNEVMNFKARVTTEKVKYSEPGNIKKDKDAIVSKSSEVSLGVDSQIDFSNSFIEEFDSKTKEIITSSFISEVEEEVNQRKKLKDELMSYNKNQPMRHEGEKKQAFTGTAGVASKPAKPVMPKDMGSGEYDNSTPTVISFDDSGKGASFYIIIIVIAVVLAVAGWFGWNMLNSKEVPVPEVKKIEKAVPAPVVSEPEKDETNAAQTYIDEKKTNIDAAKAAVEASKEATEAQEKAIEGIR